MPISNIQKAIELTEFESNKTANVISNRPIAFSTLFKCALKQNSRKDENDFYRRYVNLVNQSKQLYADMVDSKKVSMMDARVILPKCLETFYIDY